MTLQILFWSYFAIFFIVGFFKFRSRDFLEILPSLFWTCLMALPFWLQRDIYQHADFEAQSYGILDVGLLLLIADSFEGRKVGLIPNMVQPGVTALAQSLLILTAGLQVIHLAFLDYDIQLVHWIIDGKFQQSVTNHHLWLQVGLVVATPLTLALLLLCQRIWLAVFFYVFSVFYGLNLSPEFGLMFGLSGILIFGVELTHFVSRRIWVALLGLLFIPIVLLSLSLSHQNLFALDSGVTFDEVQKLRTEGEFVDTEIKNLSQADEFRLLEKTERYQNLSLFSKLMNSAFFKTFLIPSESSSRWYQYYPEIAHEPAPSENWNDYAVMVHRPDEPAHQVALWSLNRRYPKDFDKNSYVWASAEADAYAHFGAMGIFVVVVGVFFARLAIKLLRVRSRWGDALNVCALFFLGFALPNAPGPAVLIRYGVVFFIFLMGLYYFLSRKYLKQDYLPSSRNFD